MTMNEEFCSYLKMIEKPAYENANLKLMEKSFQIS